MGNLKEWVQRSIAEMLLMEVGQAEELASCLLAMPVGSAKQKAEAMQFLKDFLGDSSAVTAFGQEVIARRTGISTGPLPPTTVVAAKQPAPSSSRQQLSTAAASSSSSSSSSSLVGKSSGAGKGAAAAAGTGKVSSSLSAAAEDFWGAPAPVFAPASPSGGGGGGGRKGQDKKTGDGERLRPPPPPPQQQQQRKQEKGQGEKKATSSSSSSSSSLGIHPAKPQPPPPPPGIGVSDAAAIGAADEPPTPICGCMGAVHTPLGNCLACGRIACEVEGWRRCPFCGVEAASGGMYRCRPPQQLKRDIQAAASRAAKQQGPSHSAYGQEYEAAVALREKLLMFDQTMAERSRVFDDQQDYYNTDWMSQEEKEKLEAAEETRREAMDRRRCEVKIGIDIAGRRVVLEQDSTDPFACPPSVAAIAPASGFYPSVDVAHGLSEAAERRMRGRGEVEGEGLPLLPSSHGAAQLSGRAREVYESLTQHYQKVVAKTEKKKEKTSSAAATAAVEGDTFVPQSARLQHEEGEEEGE